MLCFLFLVAFTGAAVLLAIENQRVVELTVFNKSFTMSISALVGLAYAAGMLSGWTIVGMLRRSLNRITQKPLPGEYARAH